jgi:MazG family protein
MAPAKKLSRKSAKRQTSRRQTRRGDHPSAGAWFEKLVALQERLRAPNGCPWDREQTHATLRTYLIEEAYEVLDALDSGEDARFAEEMGDLLLQIVFHSQIAKEGARFTVSDVIREVHDKMVRRHPHVFGTKRATNTAEVLRNWDQIKTQERRTRDTSNATSEKGKKPASLLDGVPRALPALLEGLQLTKKAARVGFDWDSAAGVFDKLREESVELQHALEANHPPKIEEELGDMLFAAVNLARLLKVDPEIALKKANAKFLRRFREMERLASSSGRSFEKVSRAEMETLWDIAKRSERTLAPVEAEQNR